MTSVDVAVIGRGPIGSAAARHLAEGGYSIALIGPDEAPESARTGNRGPFASHHDEGRITRIAGNTLLWSELALRSIRRYTDLAQRSEIAFHAAAGLVVATPSVDEWIDHGLITGSSIRKVDNAWLHDVTGIVLPDDVIAAYEGPPAGHINPRRLVEAQTALTEAAGGTVLRGTVTSISKNNGRFSVVGDRGTVSAARVLLATGAFGRNLVDGSLVVERRPRTSVMAETAFTAPLPCLISGGVAGPELDGFYWVPPVRYPDGRVCIKLGGNLASEPVIEGDKELVEWFQGRGDRAEADALIAALGQILPGLGVTSVTTRPCVITVTPTGSPYIGWIDDNVAVAVGGNGQAAKASDEIGRLAASLFSPEGWTDSLDAEVFRPQLR